AKFPCPRRRPSPRPTAPAAVRRGPPNRWHRTVDLHMPAPQDRRSSARAPAGSSSKPTTPPDDRTAVFPPRFGAGSPGNRAGGHAPARGPAPPRSEPAKAPSAPPRETGSPVLTPRSPPAPAQAPTPAGRQDVGSPFAWRDPPAGLELPRCPP